MNRHYPFHMYRAAKWLKRLDQRFLSLDEEYEGYDPYNHTGSKI